MGCEMPMKPTDGMLVQPRLGSDVSGTDSESPSHLTFIGKISVTVPYSTWGGGDETQWSSGPNFQPQVKQPPWAFFLKEDLREVGIHISCSLVYKMQMEKETEFIDSYPNNGSESAQRANWKVDSD
eukprot:5603417-Amphidinium_carterae.1